MELEEAYTLVSRALDEGRAAHGYLVVGDIRGEALEFAYRILEKLFGEERVRGRAHPDIHWLLPELKSRVISVEAMRTRIVDPMTQTAFAGGWKAGVIVGADRLKKEGANAFLKTLEEPTPNTIFLLLTDSCEQLLPTIVSRCQRIDLARPGGRRLRDPWQSRVLKILSGEHLNGVTAKAAVASRLAALLSELGEKAEELVKEEVGAAEADSAGEETTKEQFQALVAARYREFRSDFMLSLLSWFRDLAAIRCAGDDVPLTNAPYKALLTARSARLTRAQALRNVEAVETLATSFERNMNEAAVLFAFTDRVEFGTEAK